MARCLICLLLLGCSDNVYNVVGTEQIPASISLRYYDTRWAVDVGDGFWVAYSYGYLVNESENAITVRPGLDLRYDSIESEPFMTAYGVIGNEYLSIPPFDGLADTVSILLPGEGADFSVVTIPFQRGSRDVYGYSIFDVEVR